MSVGMAFAMVAYAGPTPTSPISGEVAPPNSVRDDSATPSSTTPLHLVFTLKNINAGALHSYSESVMDPKSPNYKKFLTMAQIGQRFGAPQSEVDAVAGFAKSNGMKISMVWPNRMFVSAETTVANAQKVFGVSILGYKRPSTLRHDFTPETMYAADRAPTVPSTLAPVLSNVIGLSDMFMQRPADLHLPSGGGSPINPPPPPGQSSAFSSALTPWQIDYFYGTGTQHNLGLQGGGTIIAINSPTLVHDTDINAFASYFGYHAPYLYHYAIDGGATGYGGEVEACLDAQVVIGQAHDTSVVFFECPNNGSGNLDNYLWMVYYNYQVCTDSWAWTDELGLYNSNNGYFNSVEVALDQMATVGIAHYGASGDWTAKPDGTNYRVSFPTSSPSVTSVGGTDNLVDSSNYYVSETGWNGSGGGYSAKFWRPSWQNAPGVNTAFNVARQVPDVSAAGGPTPGYWVYNAASGGWLNGVYGTSASTPLWASVHLLTDQWSGRQGSLNGKYYWLATYTPWAFHDISGGNNGYPCQGGYDLVTGIGSADFGHLFYDLTGKADLAPYGALAGGKAVIAYPKAGTLKPPLFYHETLPYYFAAAEGNFSNTDAPYHVVYINVDGSATAGYYFGGLAGYYWEYGYDLAQQTLPVGHHTIGMMTDAWNNILEGNELNNLISYPITVYPALTGFTATGVKGGTKMPATCTFSSALPTTGPKIVISSSNGAIIPKQTFTATPGATSVNLQVGTNAVGATTTLTVTATYGAMKRQVRVTLTP